jgi:hypothetical protein
MVLTCGTPELTRGGGGDVWELPLINFIIILVDYLDLCYQASLYNYLIKILSFFLRRHAFFENCVYHCVCRHMYHLEFPLMPSLVSRQGNNSKVVPAHLMKTCWRSKSIAPLILNLATRWR